MAKIRNITLQQNDNGTTRAFRRQYILTIEGDPEFEPLAWANPELERRHLNSLHALDLIADQVERYYQTTLQDRKVTIEPI